MGNDNLDAHLDELGRIASTLHRGASELEGPAGRAPDPPDAGASTGVVAGALAELGAQITALSKDLDEMAHNVTSSRGSYHETDVDNANEIDRNVNGGH